MHRELLGLLVAAMLLTGAVQGQDSLNVTQTSWLFTNVGGTNDVTVANNYAYLACSVGLVITTSSEPVQWIGYCSLPAAGQKVVVQGNFAYVADGWSGGLRVIDISNPANPQETGFYIPSGNSNTRAVAVAGDHAYIGHGGNLLVIDITNPTSPTEEGSFNTYRTIYDIAILGNYAYLANSDSGLRIIDISNPAVPVEVGNILMPSNANSVTVSGDYAFVTDSWNGLRVINISNPAAPVEVGHLSTPVYALDVAVSGMYAYVAVGNSGLWVVNISNPFFPFLSGSIDVSDYAQGLSVSGDYVYLADKEIGIELIDVSNPNSPQEAGFYQAGGMVNKIVNVGGFAYMAKTDHGLQIYDISNPASPQEVGYYETGDFTDMVISANYLYLVGYYQLTIVDISNPTHPVWVGGGSVVGDNQRVAVSGTYAYVSGHVSHWPGPWYSFEFHVVDISNPTSPQVVGNYTPPGFTLDVAASGNYVYLATQVYGLRVIDVSNPTQPVEVGVYYAPGLAGRIAVSGNYAFEIDSDALRVLDISNPPTPVQVGFCVTPHVVFSINNSTPGVMVSGDHVFGAFGASGLRVFNVSNPASPYESGFYVSPFWPSGVAVAGTYAYLAQGYILGIYDCSAALPVNPWPQPENQPLNFTLHPPSPNPFNASTALSYQLQAPSFVSLKVYDTAGRLVATLVEEWKQAGTHEVTFDGSGLASGIYLAKMTAGEFSAVQKIVLLK
jgi:hypothetical protein